MKDVERKDQEDAEKMRLRRQRESRKAREGFRVLGDSLWVKEGLC